MTEFGEDVSRWLWDGPEDSDEEVEELLPFKNDQEKQLGVQFSKNGIIKFVEAQLELESPDNKKNAKNAKLWEKQLQYQGIAPYTKKGGSRWAAGQPFLRTESTFNKKFKLDRLMDLVSKGAIARSWSDFFLCV